MRPVQYIEDLRRVELRDQGSPGLVLLAHRTDVRPHQADDMARASLCRAGPIRMSTALTVPAAATAANKAPSSACRHRRRCAARELLPPPRQTQLR